MDKLKWVCDYNPYDGTNLSFEKDRAYGFSWPQRNYRCSFCNKEFKSAQALGGHMNVHRRDRARLRLSPNPNPNQNPSFVHSAARLVPCNMACRSSLAAVINSSEEKGSVVNDDDDDVMVARRKDTRVWKKANELIRLDLNLNLNLGLDLFHGANEDLDLELRLGSS